MGSGASKEENKGASETDSKPKTDAPSAAASAEPESKTDAPAASAESESKTDAPAESKSDDAESKSDVEPAPSAEMKQSDGEEPQIPTADSIKRAQSLGDIFEGEEEFFSAEEALSAGKNLGKVLRQEAEEVMQKHAALVFDCGTGETKAIFLQYYRDEDDQPIVKMKELGKAPATLDFLQRKKASDNEDYKTKCKKVETNKDKRGNTVYDTEEARLKAKAKLNDGYWFLDKKPEGATDELIPQYFVDFCVQTKQKLIDNNQTPDTVMIGCSAWARDAGEFQGEADALVVELTNAGLLCKKLLQTQEGAFEAAAVGYAYNAMMSAGPGDERLPTGLIGSGGGSVQFMNHMLYPVNMDCGNRMCLEAMQKAYDESSEEAGLASLDACFKQSDSFASTENVSTKGLHGRVQAEIDEERERTIELFPGDDKAKEAINNPLGGNIICISACYYGALSIGRANEKDLEMDDFPCSQIIKEMKEKIKEDKQKLREGKHSDRKARGTLFKEIANLTLQTSLFKELFTEDAMLCFKRNWTLNGIPFRTTWTAGWYLNFLYGLQISFPGAEPILKDYAAQEAKAQKVCETAVENLGAAVSQDVAMVLVDLEFVIKGMRRLALKIANPIDKFLKGIADKYNGEMYGWPKYKIKGNKSLYRKLIGTIFQLLKKNEAVPGYTPNVEECVESIHDSLRYTVVFPPETYTEAVKAIEYQLLVPDKARAQSIKFKNFWREEDDETTYQGINAQVKLKPVIDLDVEEIPVDKSKDIDEEGGFKYTIPKPTGAEIPNSADFIFELQIHTPQSYAMKDGPGHLLYEHYRDPAIKKGTVLGVDYDGTGDRRGELNKFKIALYKTNKELYRSKAKDGTPLKEGDVVCKGLKSTEDHEWTDKDYTFKPFKPEPPIAFYESKVEGAEWINKLQVNKTIEKSLTRKPYPHGYRIK